jgi:mycoredoxin-dependent peroxiredoxin
VSITPGTPAPDFELVDQTRTKRTLGDFKGSKTLIVFIPFAFSGLCSGELCYIRDHYATLNDLDADVVAISCDSHHANKAWADANGFEFPLLADFWPHGAVARAYGAFNETTGSANRFTFVLDEDCVVREVINTESLGVAREFEEYTRALAAI